MANPWDTAYNPTGAIAKTLQGGGSMFSGIPANHTGYPSQNYADFQTPQGGGSMYPSGTSDIWGGNYSQMLGTRADTAPFFESEDKGPFINNVGFPSNIPMAAPTTNIGQDLGAFIPGVSPTQGINSIQAWGGGSPNTPGMMWGDPTWSGIPGQAGTMWGAGLNAPVVTDTTGYLKDDRPMFVITLSPRLTRMDVDPPTGYKVGEQVATVVQSTPTGPDDQPGCGNGYTYDPEIQACVLSIHSSQMSGLSVEQKLSLLSNQKLFELYLENKVSVNDWNNGMLGPVSNQSDAAKARNLIQKYGGRDEPVETFLSPEELEILRRYQSSIAGAE